MRVFFLTSMIQEWLEQGKPLFSRHLCMCEAPAHPWRYWAKAVQKMDDLIWSILLSDTSYMWPQRQVHETHLFSTGRTHTDSWPCEKGHNAFHVKHVIAAIRSLGGVEGGNSAASLKGRGIFCAITLTSCRGGGEEACRLRFFCLIKMDSEGKTMTFGTLEGDFFFSEFQNGSCVNTPFICHNLVCGRVLRKLTWMWCSTAHSQCLKYVF